MWTESQSSRTEMLDKHTTLKDEHVCPQRQLERRIRQDKTMQSIAAGIEVFAPHGKQTFSQASLKMLSNNAVLSQQKHRVQHERGSTQETHGVIFSTFFHALLLDSRPPFAAIAVVVVFSAGHVVTTAGCHNITVANPNTQDHPTFVCGAISRLAAPADKPATITATNRNCI